MITFSVSAVPRAAAPLPYLDPAALTATLRRPVEQLGPGAPLVICDDLNPLVAAARCAFYEHRPLVLSPDIIWFCLAQGFALHVARDPERLRSRLVSHPGKSTLMVVREDFRLGQNNPWPEVFAAFADLLAQRVGKLRDWVGANFSTTGPVERAAFDLVLMDIFQPYFEYEFVCGCGIPEITLTGTPADWRQLRQKAALFAEFDLQWWTAALLPILDNLVLSSEGRPPPRFWESFFHYQGGSLGEALTGWIMVLFPYLQTTPSYTFLPHDVNPNSEIIPVSSKTLALAAQAQKRDILPNPYLGEWRHFLATSAHASPSEWGPAPAAIPPGTARAPLKVEDLSTGSQLELSLIGGLMGVGQNAAGALIPEFNWAICRAD